ncbi:MAG: barstar family protein [Ruminococcus sp.]|nr:barstar family protein [Ruminococcus sp.]
MRLAEKPTIITLDFHDCKYPEQIHQVLKEAFGFPDWYGRNWSAFWDLLNEPREYTVVEVTGLYSLHKELYEYSKKIIELLEKNKNYYKNFMEIQDQWDRRFDYKVID